MSRIKHIKTVRRLVVLIAILTSSLLLIPGSGWAQHPSGMSLNLYLYNEIPKDDPVYNIQDATDKIGLICVIKNDLAWPINTNVGIKEIKLEQHLIATDPCGDKHIAVEEIQAPEDMLPSSSWGNLDTVPAEVIQPGYERSVRIEDLRNLFPAMNKIPGEWIIQTSIPISRFLYTINDQDGIRGVDDRAFHGTLTSNQLRIFVVPDYGARLKIRVEDLSKPDRKYQPEVKVRVYKGSDLEAGNFTLADAWNKLDPLVRGRTDQGGWATLPDCPSCLPLPDIGDNYVAIAEYQGKYKEALFEDDASGWASNCSGRIERYILFNEMTQEFSVFGLNSVWLRNNVRIDSGDVGANNECSPCIIPNFEVALDGGVWIAEGSTIKGDRVYLEGTSSIWDVEFNELAGSGRVRGEMTTPLDLPIWEALIDYFPKVNEMKPGNKDINVGSHALKNLTPGKYDDVTVGSHAKLFLQLDNGSPAVFIFDNLTLDSHALLICDGPTEIRIKNKLVSNSAKSSYLGPAAGSGLSARDVVIYVAGSPQAIMLGQGNKIRANMFAKNGSLTTGNGCILEGSFIAKDVTIGQKSIVRYDSAFSQGDGGTPPAPNVPPTAEFTYIPDGLTVNFTDQSTDGDGSVVSWNWNFGDGGSTSTARHPSHTYAADGTYTVVLQVTDNDGDISSTVQDVTVSDGIAGGSIDLSGVSRKAGKKYYVDLTWDAADTTNVDIFRGGNFLTSTYNDGSYSDSLGKTPNWPYTYQVCNQGSEPICSDPVTVSYP